MSWWGIGIGAAGLLVSAAGTGMSYFGQQQQAQNASAVASYNAQVQAQNNRINLQLAQRQAQYAQRQAQVQAQASRNNATIYQNQAAQAEAVARETARRQRVTDNKQKATQRARYSTTGVLVNEGSPLEVMSEQAALMEVGIQDVRYQGQLEGDALRQKAKDENWQAGFSDFDASIAKYEEAAAKTGFDIQQNQNRVDLATGQSRAAGYNAASYGTLISGAGDALSFGSKIADRWPK